MKRLHQLLLLLLIAGIVGCAKDSPAQAEKSVPENILQKFKADYPNAEDVEWETEGENYAVEFERKESGLEMELVYDKNATVLMSEEEINPQTLPAPALTYLQDNHPENSIGEAEKISKGTTISYEVEVDVEGQELEIQFDEYGNYVGEELEDDDDDDDDDD